MGRQLVQPRRLRASTPTSCCSWPTSASRCFRLDAIAFLWKRLGTNCQNQPEVHAITQALRARGPDRLPRRGVQGRGDRRARSDLVHYLGQGAHHGKVSDLAYHNSLMVQVWSMLAAPATPGSPRRRCGAAARRRRRPPGSPTSAATTTSAGPSTTATPPRSGCPATRTARFLSDFYSGAVPRLAGARAGVPGQPGHRRPADQRHGGEPGRARGGEAGGDRGALDAAVARLLLAHAIVLGWGGIPVIWMGDELALPNDPDWAQEPGHEADNRWAHRPRLRLGRRRSAGTTRRRCQGRVFAGLRTLAQTRAGAAAPGRRRAGGGARAVRPRDPAGPAPPPVGPMLGLYNVTGSWRPWPGWRLDELGLIRRRRRPDRRVVVPGDDGNLWLAPYQALWLVNLEALPEPDQSEDAAAPVLREGNQ